MSNKSATTKTLAEKLLKKGRVGAAAAVQDIEDTIKAPYFSPVQTRQQRKTVKIASLKLELPKGIPILATAFQEKPHVDSKSTNLLLGGQLPKEEERVRAAGEWQPKNWQRMLQNIRQMRATATAPVDSMGCHKCSDVTADEKGTQRYQKLVALMLSSQTKDDVTFEAMQRLKDVGLSPANIKTMAVDKLEGILRPVSFYKNKAKYLQLASGILLDKYDGDIPHSIKELVALPGVGPKMAHLCMATAWNEVTGIGVDVHVHRITNRLQWLPKPTKEPEQTRIALESWLPREMWQDVNHLLVGFGQTVCTAMRPHCAECLNRDICPAAPKGVKNKSDVTELGEEAAVAIKKAKFQKKKLHL